MKKIQVIVLFLILLPAAAPGQKKDGYSLDDCRRLAKEHNQKIKIAEEQKGAADEIRKAAFTEFLPNFSINGTYARLTKEYQLLSKDMFLPVVPYSAIDATTGGLSNTALSDPAVAASTFVINPLTGKVVTDASGNPVFKNYSYLPASETKINFRNVYAGNAGFTQPVFMGGKIIQMNRIARLNEQVAGENRVLAEDEVVYSVDEAYWRVVSLNEKVRLADQYESMLKRLVADIENFSKEGLITGNDLLRARVRLSEIQLMQLKASNGYELSKMALCQVTGVEYNSSVSFTDSLSLDSKCSADSLAEFRLNDRPEIRMLGKGVEIADAWVSLMRSRYMPNIGLSAGFLVMNPNPYRGFAQEFGSDWTVGIVCNIPVFHFGEKVRTMKAAEHERKVAQLRLDETGELITLQVRQSEFRYREAVKKTELAGLSLDQAKENLRLTADNFAEGRLKTTDMLEAQAEWEKAVSELIDAKTERLLALSNLKKAKGIH
ncbi:MAG TPA: TolC family protein [Bacteroidales bacterium]|nr:TolC family protein [Bacteroidales bacterium]